MAKFLFTSLPIEGHSASPLSIMAQLTSASHEVQWLAGIRYAERAARVGAHHVPLHLSTDFSLYDDVFDVQPELRELSGITMLKAGFRELFLGQTANQVAEIEQVLESFPADVIVSSGPQFGPVIVAERTGIPLALVGDGPFGTMNVDTPPFGPGLRPWGSPIGRVRNRLLNAVVRRVFADVQQTWVDVRTAHAMPGPHTWAFDAMQTGDLILHGCVPGFEYRREFPRSLRFVGAHRPLPPATWQEPAWWRELDGSRPVVHLTQGTLRADPAELVVPVIEALADDDVLVVVTTGAIDPSLLGDLPANVRVAPFIPYEALLDKASVFVTNGGYIGTNLALHHGVPVVQVGATEEKAEIGARVGGLGLGVAFKKLPSRTRLRAAIHRALDDETLRSRVARVAADYRRHDAPAESAALLVELAGRGGSSRTPTAHTVSGGRDRSPSG